MPPAAAAQAQDNTFKIGAILEQMGEAPEEFEDLRKLLTDLARRHPQLLLDKNLVSRVLGERRRRQAKYGTTKNS